MAGGEGGFAAELLRAAVAAAEADQAETAAPLGTEPQSGQATAEADKPGQAEATPQAQPMPLPMPVAAAAPHPTDLTPASTPQFMAAESAVASGAPPPQQVMAPEGEASDAEDSGMTPRPVASGRILPASSAEGAISAIQGEVGSRATISPGAHGAMPGPAAIAGTTSEQPKDEALAAQDRGVPTSGLEPAVSLRKAVQDPAAPNRNPARGRLDDDQVPASPPQHPDAKPPDVSRVEAPGAAERVPPPTSATPSTGAAPTLPAPDMAPPQVVQGLAPTPAAPALPAEAFSPPPPRPIPAPPVRQLAPVCIALTLGPGQAPRLIVALEPEELGRVEIRIERDAEGEAAAVQVTAARPETLALLQRDARELDRALQQAGIPLGEGALRFGLSGQDQPGGQGGGGGRPRRGGALPDRGPDPPVRQAASTLSLLDIAI